MVHNKDILFFSMKILPEFLEFEWDEGNIDKNLIEHEVTNQEAEEVFSNEPKLILEDEKHFLIEKRFMLWGNTNANRKLAVIFTLRDNKIRIISARDMSRKEREAYVKKIQIYAQI